MTTSARIRALASEGMATAEIARQLGIRYQHAYKVLKASSLSPPPTGRQKRVAPSPITKPPLPLSVLTEGGFAPAGRWMFSPDGELIVDVPLPKAVGVYAFVKDGFALYVGVGNDGDR